ncbi:MAG: hypothetical protein QOI80_793 [Solirubrobacteraceae bacterium]|nr:hypothetical protein [Solirubrobacteraceae bacterium]
MRLPWIAVLVAYVAAALTLSAWDPSPQTPFLLQRLRDDGGRELTAVVLAVPAVLAFAFAAALARRWVPDPWATRGVLVVALSPLGFALTSGARPDGPAAALLAGGLLLALQAREHATRGRALGSAACLSLAPWFGVAYAFAAAPVLAALVSWTSRRGRPLLAFLSLEIAGATTVALAGIDQPDGRAATHGDGAVRVGRVLVDTLRWAPLLLLAFGGAYLLLRSRREKVSRAIPTRRDAEVAAALAGVMILALWGVAAFGTVGPGAGVPLAAAYAAWGLRRTPRLGFVLGLATLTLTGWMAVALAAGDTHRWLHF